MMSSSEFMSVNIRELENWSGGPIPTQTSRTNLLRDLKDQIIDIFSNHFGNPNDGLHLHFFRGKIKYPFDESNNHEFLPLVCKFEEDTGEVRFFVDRTNFQSDSDEIKIFTFKCPLSDTIQDVYLEIERKWGTAINPWVNEEAKLRMFAGEWPSTFEQEDGGSLIPEISVPEAVALHEKNILVFVEPKTPRKYTIDELEPEDTIAEIKRSIEEILDIYTSEQILTFNGVDLEDDQTLSYYGICDESVLVLEKRCQRLSKPTNIRIIVTMLGGQHWGFEFDRYEKIISVKDKISEEAQIPITKQRLHRIDGSILEDEQVLSSCGIENGEQILLFKSS